MPLRPMCPSCITGKWANLTSIFGGLESQVGSSLNESTSIL